jgi:hypothetical protein
VLAGCVALLAGCGKSNSPELSAKLDASAVAAAALQDWDKNKNGQLEGAELDACPALKSALAIIDKNKDKSLSAAEIRERVEQYAEQRTVPVTCVILLDGQPLEGATVTFEPEPCMGPALKPATAMTDSGGSTGPFQVENGSYTSLPPGLYRIKVTKAGAKLPTRYNTQTTLGREVTADPRTGEAIIELALVGR